MNRVNSSVTISLAENDSYGVHKFAGNTSENPEVDGIMMENVCYGHFGKSEEPEYSYVPYTLS